MNRPLDPKTRLDIHEVLGADPAAASGRSRRVVAWILALAVAAAAGFGWHAKNDRPAAARYVTEPLARGALTVAVTATGSVQPTKKVDVSSELSGTIRKVLVDYNSLVRAGETLAELDTDKLKATADSSRARLAAARAKVSDAEAALREKQRDLARKRTLAGKEFTSEQALDLAQAAAERALAAVEVARADVGVAEAELRLNETNLAKSVIVSPISGVVLRRNVDPGQTVASTLQAPVLFSIAEDLRQMELQVDVDEADVGKVRVGQGASFSVDAFPERRFPAAIRDIRFASEAIQGVVTYKAVLTIDNTELLLRPGMTATAEIRVIEIADALLVPNAALRYTPQAAEAGDTRGFLRRLLPGMPQFRPPSPHEDAGPERAVWVLRDEAPLRQRVTVGPSDGKRTVVASGDLKPGDRVVIDQVAAKR